MQLKLELNLRKRKDPEQHIQLSSWRPSGQGHRRAGLGLQVSEAASGKERAPATSSPQVALA